MVRTIVLFLFRDARMKNDLVGRCSRKRPIRQNAQRKPKSVPPPCATCTKNKCSVSPC